MTITFYNCLLNAFLLCKFSRLTFNYFSIEMYIDMYIDMKIITYLSSNLFDLNNNKLIFQLYSGYRFHENI